MAPSTSQETHSSVPSSGSWQPQRAAPKTRFLTHTPAGRACQPRGAGPRGHCRSHAARCRPSDGGDRPGCSSDSAAPHAAARTPQSPAATRMVGQAGERWPGRAGAAADGRWAPTCATLPPLLCPLAEALSTSPAAPAEQCPLGRVQPRKFVSPTRHAGLVWPSTPTLASSASETLSVGTTGDKLPNLVCLGFLIGQPRNVGTSGPQSPVRTAGATLLS